MFGDTETLSVNTFFFTKDSGRSFALYICFIASLRQFECFLDIRRGVDLGGNVGTEIVDGGGLLQFAR